MQCFVWILLCHIYSPAHHENRKYGTDILVVIVVCDTELHDGKVHQVQSKLASFKLYQLRISSVVVFEAKSAGRNPATSG
jgi:hypothetical protein